MKVKKTIKWAALAAMVAMCASCGKDGDTGGDGPQPTPDNTITIAGVSYDVNNGEYSSGMYSYVGLECTSFYIYCSNGAGITIRLEEHMVGRQVSFEPGDTFWFFAVGNGQGTFVPLQNGDTYPWYSVSDKYSGWFRIERDLDTDYCTLSYVLNRNGVEGWSKGDVGLTFVRKSPV